MFHGLKVRITGGFALLCGALLLICPADMTAAVLIAAAVHEAGHILALTAAGIRIEEIRACGVGFELRYSGILSYSREIAAALSGPAAGIVLCIVSALAGKMTGAEFFYLLSGVSLVLGVFNLLPASPLDGGRALRAAVTLMRGERAAAAVARCADIDVCAALLLPGAYFFARKGPPALLFAGIIVTVRCCNSGSNGVKL